MDPSCEPMRKQAAAPIAAAAARVTTACSATPAAARASGASLVSSRRSRLTQPRARRSALDLQKRTERVLQLMNKRRLDSASTRRAEESPAVEWQRAVSRATLLSGFGQHFGSNVAGERDWALSFHCDEYTHFISHSWRASRLAKYFALLYRFSLVPAMLAAHAAALTTCLLTATGVLPGWSECDV